MSQYNNMAIMSLSKMIITMTNAMDKTKHKTNKLGSSAEFVGEFFRKPA